MSDNPEPPEVDPEQPESPEEPEAPDDKGTKEQREPFDEDRAKAKIAKANQEAQNLRKRLKELEPLAAKAKELEDANKTETERLTEKLSGAEKSAAAAQSELLRLQVAFDKELTPAQARRLVGTTREELEADADDLLASFAPKEPKPKVPRGPQPKLRGGGDPDEPVDETDPKKLAARIRRG